MKKFLLILSFAAAALSLNAQADDLMKEGNDFYQQEKYSEAIEAYNKILNQGFESSALYYNLGNANYRKGDLGKAILYYEKGLKLSPGDEDIEYNLQVANARTVDRITEVPKLFIVEWWEALISLFTVSGWALVVAVLFILLLVIATIYYFVRNFNLQKLLLLAGISNLVVLLFAVVFMVAQINRETSMEYGVLLQESISAKISPDEKSNDAFVIHEGIKFEIQDELNEWAKIKLADGKVGWLPNSSFESI